MNHFNYSLQLWFVNELIRTDLHWKFGIYFRGMALNDFSQLPVCAVTASLLCGAALTLCYTTFQYKRFACHIFCTTTVIWEAASQNLHRLRLSMTQGNNATSLYMCCLDISAPLHHLLTLSKDVYAALMSKLISLNAKCQLGTTVHVSNGNYKEGMWEFSSSSLNCKGLSAVNTWNEPESQNQ